MTPETSSLYIKELRMQLDKVACVIRNIPRWQESSNVSLFCLRGETNEFETPCFWLQPSSVFNQCQLAIVVPTYSPVHVYKHHLPNRCAPFDLNFPQALDYLIKMTLVTFLSKNTTTWKVRCVAHCEVAKDRWILCNWAPNSSSTVYTAKIGTQIYYTTPISVCPQNYWMLTCLFQFKLYSILELKT